MPYFKRDKNAAKVQESDWRKLCRSAKRLAEYIPRPCVYCGVLMTPGTAETQGCETNETRDHITPKCKGGVVTVACCEGCNRDKHHLTVAEWRLVLMWRKRRVIVFHYERETAKMCLWEMTYILSRLLSC